MSITCTKYYETLALLVAVLALEVLNPIAAVATAQRVICRALPGGVHRWLWNRRVYGQERQTTLH